jgi:hypothetical protein
LIPRTREREDRGGVKALNELPVYYRYHIKNGLVLGKGLKIVRYQTFIKKRNQAQKRKEKKRKEI